MRVCDCLPISAERTIFFAVNFSGLWPNFLLLTIIAGSSNLVEIIYLVYLYAPDGETDHSEGTGSKVLKTKKIVSAQQM